jgi:acyl carrier protein
MSTPTQTLTGELLHLITTKYADGKAVTADTPFESLDFDSLVLVEVAVALSKRYAVTVTDDELDRAGTITGAVALLEAKGVRP